ncbi:MAG: hypothetical protein KF683_10495, partial [Rubrivivax sp.]|nr:hypothetical protein [Rubrivivax sp.]
MADLQSLRGGQAAVAGFVDPLPIVRHPGVRHRAEGTLDFYTGRAADLIAAGLAAPHELPGAPGMPRAVVQLTPEGKHRRGKVRDLPRGSRIIERFGERYRVRLVLGGRR